MQGYNRERLSARVSPGLIGGLGRFTGIGSREWRLEDYLEEDRQNALDRFEKIPEYFREKTMEGPELMTGGVAQFGQSHIREVPVETQQALMTRSQVQILPPQLLLHREIGATV